MARTPFKQRSQGSSFKMMGASPIKKDENTNEFGQPKTSSKITDQPKESTTKVKKIVPTTVKKKGWDKDKDVLYKYVTKPAIDATMGIGKMAVESFSSVPEIALTVGFMGGAPQKLWKGVKSAKSKITSLFKR